MAKELAELHDVLTASQDDLKNQSEQCFLGYSYCKSALPPDYSCHLSPSIAFKYIPLATHLHNQGFSVSGPAASPVLFSLIGIMTMYKSSQSNLTNSDVYYSDIIKQCVNAGKDDVVVFTGSGTTGAIHKLIHALQLTGKVVEKSVSTNNLRFNNRT